MIADILFGLAMITAVLVLATWRPRARPFFGSEIDHDPHGRGQ